jgi:PHD/YefM family antitoxin component YafN of YafNO toxin-antitoxin module
MNHLSANELKTRGVAAIEAALQEHSEAIVSFRGKDRYVVMSLAQYQHLRECELEAALVEAKADVEAGRIVKESVEAHLAQLDSLT